MRANLSSSETSDWITRTYGGDTDPTPDVDETPVSPITSATANENIPHP